MRIDQSSKIPATMFLRSMDPEYGATPVRCCGCSTRRRRSTPNSFARRCTSSRTTSTRTRAKCSCPPADRSATPINQIVATAKKKLEVIDEAADPLMLNTLSEDPSNDHEEALLRIYARLRPGNPPQLDKARKLFKEKFYDENRYRLGKVGRFRINRKFDQDVGEDHDGPPGRGLHQHVEVHDAAA